MRLLPILLTLALAVAPASAMVDDAHSTALEAAHEAVKQGFKIRQEYWKGSITGSGQKAVKHQVFKGSDVWFWLGTDTESAAKFEIEAYDAKGVKITVEKKSGKGWTSVHLKPEKTGTVVITFKITGKENQQIPWALVYGWK